MSDHMSEHQKVIEQALTRLYQRIQQPSAVDKIHYNAALKAARNLRHKGNEKVAGPATNPSPLEGATIAEVQALVEQDKVDVQRALEHERTADFPRKTLIAWLERFQEEENE